jgi:hypothetical protein
MIEELGDKKSFRYNFFFDNLFTEINLLCTLKANGYGATGTVRITEFRPLVHSYQRNNWQSSPEGLIAKV